MRRRAQHAIAAPCRIEDLLRPGTWRGSWGLSSGMLQWFVAFGKEQKLELELGGGDVFGCCCAGVFSSVSRTRRGKKKKVMR